MRLEKDPEVSNLYWSPKFKTYYFRKYIGAAGREVCRSLKEQNRHKAIIKLNKLLARLQREIEAHVEAQYQGPTVNQVRDELLKIYDMKSRATHESFEIVTRRHVLPYFNHVPVSQVARSWEDFKAHVKQNNPTMSLEHVRRYLTRMLNYSVERGYIDGFRKLKLDPGEVKKTTPRAYEPAEVGQIFLPNEEKTQGFKKHTLRKQRLMIRLTLELGLRPPQEIRLLKKEYFDFARGLLTLPASVVKTRVGRVIPVDAALIQEIKAWCDLYPQSPYVFPKRGNPMEPSTRSDKTWQRLKKALGLEGRRYWFRHSHATAALEGGLDAVLVARDMGTSPEMLLKVYVRPSRAVVEKRAELVRKKYGQSLG